MNVQEFGQRTTHRMDQLNIKHKKVMEACDVARTTVRNWRAGKFYPSTHHLILLAKCLVTTPNYLLGFDPKDYSPYS